MNDYRIIFGIVIIVFIFGISLGISFGRKMNMMPNEKQNKITRISIIIGTILFLLGIVVFFIFTFGG